MPVLSTTSCYGEGLEGFCLPPLPPRDEVGEKVEWVQTVNGKAYSAGATHGQPRPNPVCVSLALKKGCTLECRGRRQPLARHESVMRLRRILSCLTTLEAGDVADQQVHDMIMACQSSSDLFFGACQGLTPRPSRQLPQVRMASTCT